VFLQSLPIVLALRYVSFVAAGIYRRIWRFASAHDLAAIAVSSGVSGLLALGVVSLLWPLNGFDWKVFPLDAVLCAVLVAGARLALRLRPHHRGARREGPRRRVLLVGAGRSGRSLARELREDAAVRVVGFLDDNPAVRRRRVHGIVVLGALDEVEAALESASPDEVLITIPNAAVERLDRVTRACAAAGVACRLVHRRTETTVPTLAEAGVE
jgi:FlaA1/EpsC-like NDP-sugar epimerase